MTTIVFMVQAMDGERFAAEAFTGSIGKTLNVRMPGGVASGKLLDARVVEWGRGAQLTMDIDEATLRSLGVLTMKPGEYSIGFTQGEGVHAVPIPVRAEEPWQDLQADHEGVTPYGPEEWGKPGDLH